MIEALANEHTVDSASLRSDKKQQHVEEQVMPKSVHLNNLFLLGRPFEKGLKQLHVLRKCSYQFTYVPSINELDEQQQKIYIEQMHKLMYGLWKQSEAMEFFGTAGELQIQNTSKDPHKLLFRKITATRNHEGSLSERSVQLKQKEFRETAVAISEGVGVELLNSNQWCILCFKKLVINCTIEAEAALVNEKTFNC